MDTKIEFLFLNEEDMIKAGVLDAGHCVDTVGEVMSLLSSGDYLMGGKEHNDHGMPAYLGGRFHLAGEKWYGSNGRNAKKGLPRSILMVTLNDVETGQPLAYMSANLLSAMRTGAMPGLSAVYLARKDSKVLALIGAGVVNRTSFMAIMAKMPGIEEVRIKGSSSRRRLQAQISSVRRYRLHRINGRKSSQSGSKKDA